MGQPMIGIPTNEKMCSAIISMLRTRDFSLNVPEPGHFFVVDQGATFVFARMSEIARLVRSGEIDCGFVTKDCWVENGTDTIPCGDGVRRMLEMPFLVKDFSDLCRCTIAFITSSETRWDMGIHGESGIISALLKCNGAREKPRIATRFPRLTKAYLMVGGSRWVNGQNIIKKVDGGEELHVLLGSADFAVVQIETGATIRRYGLVIVEEIMASHLLLVSGDPIRIEEFAARLH